MKEGFVPVEHATHFRPLTALGEVRYRADLGRAPLDALLVNKRSEVLVVSFHGALDRASVSLPRFERYRTLTDLDCSSLYFADPTLHLDERLTLSWYTGWAEIDLPLLIAEWVRSAAAAVGARKVVLSGSSGGGFAALQVASHLPGSVAVVFNPQTAISRYTVNGKRWVQRRYVEIVMPHLAEDGFDSLDSEADWSLPLGARASVVRRYSVPQASQVVYVQNLNDASHMKDHYGPFLDAINDSRARDRLRVLEYDGPPRHAPPSRELYLQGIRLGVDCLEVAKPGESDCGALSE